jgi:hypothetical protein
MVSSLERGSENWTLFKCLAPGRKKKKKIDTLKKESVKTLLSQKYFVVPKHVIKFYFVVTRNITSMKKIMIIPPIKQSHISTDLQQ